MNEKDVIEANSINWHLSLSGEWKEIVVEFSVAFKDEK